MAPKTQLQEATPVTADGIVATAANLNITLARLRAAAKEVNVKIDLATPVDETMAKAPLATKLKQVGEELVLKDDLSQDTWAVITALGTGPYAEQPEKEEKQAKKPSGKGKASGKAKAEKRAPAAKDEFGFRVGSKKAHFATLLKDEAPLSMERVKEAVGYSMYNAFNLLAKKGLAVRRDDGLMALTGSNAATAKVDAPAKPAAKVKAPAKKVVAKAKAKPAAKKAPAKPRKKTAAKK